MKQMNKYILGKNNLQIQRENCSRHMFVVEKVCLFKCMGED